jgi:hypothetical protein
MRRPSARSTRELYFIFEGGCDNLRFAIGPTRRGWLEKAITEQEESAATSAVARPPEDGMSSKILALTLVIPLLALQAGCQSLLPAGAASTPQLPWGNYADAVGAIDRIVPYQTTREELRQQRIDPAGNPAITILSYTDLLQRLTAVSAVTPEHMERGIADCLNAGKRCNAYAINAAQINTHRIGNFWLDMLNFRQRTLTTGWSLSALIIFIDDVAVFAVAGGQPNINTEQFTRNPLGPLQGLGASVHPTIF